MQDYINTKLAIFTNQKAGDYAIFNMDNKILKEFMSKISSKVKSRTISISLRDSTANYYLDSTLNIYKNGKKKINIGGCKLNGTHNLYNILCAYAVASIYRVKNVDILQILKTFKGIKGRQEIVRKLNGVTFINDTTATSVEAMIYNLERFGKTHSGKIVMISGGVDKGVNYNGVKDLMEKHLKKLVLLEGTASEKLFEILAKSSLKIDKYYGNFEKAIKTAYKSTQKGDLIILCPGAASFNMFINEFDRGEQFNKIVSRLK